MFFTTLCFLTIVGWFQVQCYVAVPSIYQKADTALRHYSSETESNPVVFSLLNVLVHDKRAKPFTTDQAIEKSLEDVKKYNRNDEKILREIIYGKPTSSQFRQLPKELKENIQSALDTFFSHEDVDDYQTFDILANNKKL